MRERRTSSDTADAAALVGAGDGASVGTLGFYARASAASPRATSVQATSGACSRAEAATTSRSVAGLRRPSMVRTPTISARLRRSTRSVSWKYVCTRGGNPGRTSARARSPMPCDVGTAQRIGPSSPIRAGLAELGPCSPVFEVRRAGDARRAVGVAQLRAGGGDRTIGVPPATAEERRCDPALRQPGALAAHPLRRVATGRSRVRRAREMRVVPETGRATRPRAHARARARRPSPRPRRRAA